MKKPENLIIVLSFIEVEEIFSVIFYLNLEGFSTLYLMSGWMFLDYYSWLLLGCYHCREIDIIVEWLLLLLKNLLILTGEYFRSLLLTSQRIIRFCTLPDSPFSRVSSTQCLRNRQAPHEEGSCRGRGGWES